MCHYFFHVLHLYCKSIIKNLVELESIDISETSISDFDFLYSLEKLKEVKASGEQLSNDDLFELKNRGIEVILC